MDDVKLGMHMGFVSCNRSAPYSMPYVLAVSVSETKATQES